MRFEKVSEYKPNRDVYDEGYISNQPTTTSRGDPDFDDKDISTRSDRKQWRKERIQRQRWDGRLDLPLSPYEKRRNAFYRRQNAFAGLRKLTDEEIEEQRKKKTASKPKRKTTKKCKCKK